MTCEIRDAVETLRVRLDDLLVQAKPADASLALDRTPVRALLAPPEEMHPVPSNREGGAKPTRRKAS